MNADRLFELFITYIPSGDLGMVYIKLFRF